MIYAHHETQEAGACRVDCVHPYGHGGGRPASGHDATRSLRSRVEGPQDRGAHLRQIDGLNRQRTLFILPVGMLEQHGPHLPVGADTIGIMYEANRVSTRVSQALPDWHVVMMPAVNYGHGGANLLGDRPIHPGTYAIRQSTLRSLSPTSAHGLPRTASSGSSS